MSGPLTGVTNHLYRSSDPSPLGFDHMIRGHAASPAETLVMEVISAASRLGLVRHVPEGLPTLLGGSAHSLKDFAHTLPTLLQGDHHA